MVTVDRVLDLLAEQRRRYALYCLDDRDDPVSVDDLATAVARMETDGSEVTDDRCKRIEVGLEHTHSPAADRAAFVEHDPATELVELTDEPPAFEAILTVAEALERPT